MLYVFGFFHVFFLPHLEPLSVSSGFGTFSKGESLFVKDFVFYFVLFFTTNLPIASSPLEEVGCGIQNLKCFTVKPLLISSFSESIPIFKCSSTKFCLTDLSLSVVFTPLEIIG